MIRREHYPFLIFGLILLIFTVRPYFWSTRDSPRGVANYKEFNESSIHGKLELVGSKYHGKLFKVDNSEKEFIFYPYTGHLNNFKIFNHVAEKGDSVLKNAYADTLILIKNDVILRYTFREYK